MAIRESLLNTITSVASSDFVRIVTSAGASSKATVANLFKSFESSLSAKSSLTTSDYVRVVGSDNESYKQSVSEVKAAMGVDDIYSKTIPVNLPSSITDLNDITSNSTYIIQGTIPANAPVSTGTYGAFVRTTQRSSTLSFQEYWKTMSTSGEFEVYARRYINGTWNPWFKLPTRAEVDEINNHGVKIGTTNASVNMRETPGGTLVKEVPNNSKVFTIGGITSSGNSYKCLYLETSTGTWYQGYIVASFIIIE